MYVQHTKFRLNYFNNIDKVYTYFILADQKMYCWNLHVINST